MINIHSLFGKTNFPFENFVLLSSFITTPIIESNLGLINPIPRSVHTNEIQAALNYASENNVPLVWDKAVATNNTLILKSNTYVYALYGKGCVMANGANRMMFRNEHVIFRENSRIIDENIRFNGGVWNGNGLKQTIKIDENGAVVIFGFFGVRNLHLQNHTMFLPKTYCQQAINIQNGVVEDFIVDVGRNGAINMDGVHFDGWCNDCRISRGVLNTYDDGVGCNADDLYYSNDYGGGAGKLFFYEDPCGSSSNIIFEDLHFDNSLFGVRILSSHSRVDNITIRNITGTTKDYAILIDNYWRKPNEIQNASIGNIGTINVDNINIVVNRGLFSDNQDAVISLSSSIENLIMTNVVENIGNVPTFAKLQGQGLNKYNYGNLILNGVKV